MTKNTEAGETSEPHDLSSNPNSNVPSQQAGTYSCLIIYRCFSLITILSALLCIAVNVIAAVVSFKNASDVFDGIFRIYAVGITVFVVVAETEWTAFFNYCQVLEYWPGRGMLQIFVGVMTRAFPDFYGQRRDLMLLQNIASYMILSCGALYLVLGILCIGCLKRRLERKETTRSTTREHTVTDLEEVERRKEQLEASLIESSV